MDRGSCERFLEGTKGNVEAAAEMMTKHLEWRESYGLDNITEEDFSTLSANGIVFNRILIGSEAKFGDGRRGLLGGSRFGRYPNAHLESLQARCEPYFFGNLRSLFHSHY